MADYINSPEDGVIRRWDMKFIANQPGEENWEAYVAYRDNGGVLDDYTEVLALDLQTAVTLAVQQRLDGFAKTRGYDNIFTACSYGLSKVEQFRREAEYCIDARDAHWAMCYSILNDVLSGARPMPTLEEVMAEMPILQWPT